LAFLLVLSVTLTRAARRRRQLVGGLSGRIAPGVGHHVDLEKGERCKLAQPASELP
jgi:hypothetical protein